MRYEVESDLRSADSFEDGTAAAPSGGTYALDKGVSTLHVIGEDILLDTYKASSPIFIGQLLMSRERCMNVYGTYIITDLTC